MPWGWIPALTNAPWVYHLGFRPPASPWCSSCHLRTLLASNLWENGLELEQWSEGHADGSVLASIPVETEQIRSSSYLSITVSTPTLYDSDSVDTGYLFSWTWDSGCWGNARAVPLIIHVSLFRVVAMKWCHVLQETSLTAVEMRTNPFKGLFPPLCSAEYSMGLNHRKPSLWVRVKLGPFIAFSGSKCLKYLMFEMTMMLLNDS